MKTGMNCSNALLHISINIPYRYKANTELGSWVKKYNGNPTNIEQEVRIGMSRKTLGFYWGSFWKYIATIKYGMGWDVPTSCYLQEKT